MGKVRELNTRGQRPVFRDQIATVTDLEEFKTELLLSIKTMLSEFKGQAPTKWLKSYQVKKLLGLSDGTLQNLRNNGTIPFTKIGGTIYYGSDDIDNMLLKMKRQPGTVRTLKRNL
jgi:hypothetical protein